MARRLLTRNTILHVLRGRTLRDIVDSETSIAANCEACGHKKIWPYADARDEPRLKPFMDTNISVLVDKMTCTNCGEKNIFLTIDPKTKRTIA